MAIMRQSAPHPAALFDLVEKVRYRPGWTITLEDIDRGQDCKGLTLIINARVPDSYHKTARHARPDDDPDGMITVWHYMPVPPAAYDMRSWRRWLFEQCRLVDDHEAMEFFRIECPTVCSIDCGQPDACHERHRLDEPVGAVQLAHDPDECERMRRPYAPNHGPGRDPYTVHELGTDMDRRTSFRGEVQSA